MRATTNYGWAHPEAGDHTRTWEYWDTFEDVDAAVKVIDDRSAAGLPTLSATFADAANAPGPANQELAFNLITVNSGLPGAAIVTGGHLKVPLRGLYLVNMSSMVYGLGWGANLACEIVSPTQAITRLYTTHSQHLSLSDTAPALLDANALLRIRVQTGGNFGAINNRVTLTMVGPWPVT